MKLPRLERETLARVVRGEDPYAGKALRVGSRIYSQALTRLRRKELVTWKVGGGHEATALGLKVHQENQ